MEKKVCTIKVLSVCTNSDNGGAAKAARRIHDGVNELRQGVVSMMFVKNKQSEDDSILSVNDFIPHNIFYNTWQWVRQKSINKYWHVLWRPYSKTQDSNYKNDLRSIDIHHAFQQMDYDVLHLHWINNRFLNLNDIPSNKPIVWTLHDSWQFCGVCHYFIDCERYQNECGCCPQLGSNNLEDLSHFIWKAKKRFYANKNVHVVCPSQWLADCAKRSSLMRNMDIRVIPNCLDTDIFRPLRKSNWANKAEKPIILYGAMNAATDKLKGFSSLLSALQILDKQGFIAHLMVFGADKTELPLCFHYINVTFVGYISDVHKLVELYNLADVMVVPSYSEVFGQTASEAMACGTPVVAFRCTGIQDVVGEYGGYLAEPFNATDLANGIKECIAHSAEWGAAARESVLQKYTPEIVAQQYIDLYQEVCK